MGQSGCIDESHRGRTILLVEDEPLLRFYTAELLRDMGYVVLEAANGDAALALVFGGHALDLVITDICMPGSLDGVALAGLIKARLPKLPVVLLSSCRLPKERHPADRFLAKPCPPRQLSSTVAEMLGTDAKPAAGSAQL